MKVNFLKKAVALVTAFTMSLGMVTVMPEGVLPQVGIVASAANSYSEFSNVPCGMNCQMSLSNGVLTISGSGPMFNLQYNGTGEMYEGLGDYDDWTYYNDYITSCKTSINEVKISNSITYIGSYAFSGTNITSVSLPNSIADIGSWAFSECNSLSTVTMNNVESIGYGSFAYCPKLTEINLPNTLKTIGMEAFVCGNITNVTIPESIKELSIDAFSGMSSLKSIIIPKGTVIDDSIGLNNSPNVTIYGYTGSDAEKFAEANNIPFVALDSTSEFVSATITQNTNPIYVNDEFVFMVSVLDSEGNSIDIPGDVTYSYSISNPNIIEITDEGYVGTAEIGINAKAIGVGTTTITVTFSNGVSASSTVNVSKNGSASEIPNYDNVSISSNPEKFSITYDTLTGAVSPSEQNFTITLSYNDLGAVVDGVEKTVTIGAIEVIAPEECFVADENSDAITNRYMKAIKDGGLLLSTSGKSHTMNMKLKSPAADYFARNNNVSDKLVVKLYDTNGTVVKTAEFNVSLKIINDNIPDGTIYIDEDVNGDIVVEEGQCVIISGNVSCNNLFVKGGICNIGTHNDPKSTLTVKNNAEVTGGKTNWASPVSVDEKGGELNVYGTLNVANNMTIGTDCGILNMTTSDCEVNVSNDFTVSTNSTVYTCNLSAGTLTIGGNFISGTSWYNKHNFRASGKHLTLFNGNDFIIKMDETDSYFNNLAFTQSALNNCEYGLDTLYTANVLGKFYIYDDKTTDLSSLFKDYQPIKSSFESKYKKYYYENSAFKTSMNDLKEYVPDDVFNKIIADTEMYCTLEWLNLPSSSNGISIPNAFGASGFTSFLNDKQGVLEFNNIKTDKNTAFKGKKVNVLIFIDNFSITLNSSYASICEIRWAITNSKDEILFASKIPATLTSNSVDNLNEELYQIWKKQSHYKDYKFWVKTFVDDCLDLYGIAGVDVSTAKGVVDLIDSIYESVVNRNLEEFKIASPEDALDLYDNLKDFTNTNSKNFGKITAFLCPVNVKVLDSTGNTVALVENNKVKVSTEAVSIEVLNGDEKYCKFNILDDYQLILTATGKGNMTYRVQELKENNVYRTVTFNNLPLQEGLIYTGSVDELYYASNLAYALTDNNNKTYTADSDTLSTTGDTGNNGGNGNTGGNGSTGNNGNAGSYVPPTTVPSYTPTFPTTIVTRPTLTVKATTKNDTVTLKWNKINNAKKYTVYQLVNGKYVKIKDTDKTSVTFKKLKSGKTYKFLVRYTVNGQKSSNAYSGRMSVTVNYKPVVKATATQNSVRLVWNDVPNAQKYAVYKYVNGRAVKLIETKKTSVKINKLTPKTKYQYIVRAYINGKWTTMTKSDIVTATTK